MSLVRQRIGRKFLYDIHHQNQYLGLKPTRPLVLSNQSQHLQLFRFALDHQG